MATIDTRFVWPPYFDSTPHPNTSSQLISLASTGLKSAFVFRVPKSGTLEKVHFRTGTVTSTGTIRVSFQDILSTVGVRTPDGTQDQYRDIEVSTSNSYYVTGSLTSDGTDGGTKRTVTAGQALAIVIENTGTGNLQIYHNTAVGNRSTPQGDTTLSTYNGTSWASAANGIGNYILEYSDGTFGVIPGSSPACTVAQTGSGGNEIGNLITVPFGCVVEGVQFSIFANNTLNVRFRHPGGVETIPYTGVSGTVVPGYVLFAEPIELAAGDQVRVTVQLTAGMIDYWYYSTENSGLLNATGVPASQCMFTTSADGENWLETSNKRTFASLMISGLVTDAVDPDPDPEPGSILTYEEREKLMSIPTKQEIVKAILGVLG